MIVRRRPLLRAAAVGGGAYVAGKRRAERSAAEAERESAERQQQSAQAAQQPSAAQAPGAGPSIAEQIKQLAALHEQGALSDEEFAAAKAKLLGG